MFCVFQFYVIKSKLNGLCLEAEGGGFQPGARVVPMDYHGRDNQVWFDDLATGTIKCKASQFCLDIESMLGY